MDVFLYTIRIFVCIYLFIKCCVFSWCRKYLHSGINTLMYIMSKMANSQETASEIHHYERLEFLGDAVIEFLSRLLNHNYLFPCVTQVMSEIFIINGMQQCNCTVK